MPVVRIRDIGKEIDVAAGQSIVDAALEHGVDYPCGCQAGACGVCKSTLLRGEVDFLPYTKSVLPDAEREGGLILACCALPRTDCEVSFGTGAGRAASAPPLRDLSARVVDIGQATHDIGIVRLRTDGPPLDFLAGQFATLAFAGVGGREYSMANQPLRDVLEFHVRHVPGGLVSGHVRHRLRPGDRVQVRGPFGAAHFRPEHRGPIIAIAGGSGLAPIKSIVDRAVETDPAREIHVYFGARSERDIYLEAHFRALAERHPRVRYVPVLSACQSATRRRTGFLADAIAADLRRLDGAKAYLAGPPVMVETCERVLAGLGLGPGDRHADIFFTRHAAKGDGQANGLARLASG